MNTKPPVHPAPAPSPRNVDITSQERISRSSYIPDPSNTPSIGHDPWSHGGGCGTSYGQCDEATVQTWLWYVLGSRVCMPLQHGAFPMPHDLETYAAVFANLNPAERTPFPVGWTSLQQDMREEPDSICLVIPMHASIAYAMTFLVSQARTP